MEHVDDEMVIDSEFALSKAKLNTLHYKLSELIEDPEVVNRSQIVSCKQLYAEVYSECVACLSKLLQLCRLGKSDPDKLQQLTFELKSIEKDFSAAMHAADRLLIPTVRDEPTILASPVMSTGYRTTGTSVNVHQQVVGQDLWRQLKRVSIPVFSGDKRMFETWKATFAACIDAAPMSGEYKMLQLRQYLSGEALKCIERLGHSAASYEAAKERLDRKFGGVRRQLAVQLEQVDEFKPVRAANAKDLDKFADLLDITVINLKESGRVDELRYGSLYLKLLRKLPEAMITSYQRWCFENHLQECVEVLRQWIMREAEFQMIASETLHGLSQSSADRAHRSKPNLAANVQSYFSQNRSVPANVKKIVCACCSGDHAIWRCEQFKKLDIPARWNLAKSKYLCFRCLSSNHLGKSCNYSKECGVNGCQKSHNRLLHQSVETLPKLSGAVADVDRKVDRDVPADNQFSSTGTVSDTVTLTVNNSAGQFIALRTVPVVLQNGSKSMKVNALLDDGSTRSYINADIADELGLTGKAEAIAVNMLNGRREVFETRPVQVQLHSLDGKLCMPITAMTANKVTGNMKVIDWHKQRDKWPHLQSIEFPKVGSRPIVDILIGIDYADLHLSYREVCGDRGQPIARLTPLGWTCIGGLSSRGSDHTGTNLLSFFVDDSSESINDSLKRFWEVESNSSVANSLSVDDQVVVNFVKSSLCYTDGKYQVEIPWKDGPPILPSNYDMAIKRLENTEQRLQKDAVVCEAYHRCIEDYLKKGYIRKCDKAEIEAGMPKWYLPHFPVVRPDKSTTKTRIVFDASACHQGISLNSVINQGPKLQKELSEVLLRFRKNTIAVACDIAEMYLQIEIAPKDRPYFCFMWRGIDRSRPPDIYEFSRVVFGVNCSPFLAQFVVQEHAKCHEAEFFVASETVLKSTYMDDSMDSVASPDEGIQLYQQLSQLLLKANMCARKWLSNSVEVMNSIPVEDQASEMKIDDRSCGVKTLGVLWLAHKDVFNFVAKPVDEQFKYTKRNVLKKVAAIFDPLGFISPYIVRAKILLQLMWIDGVDWDDPLSSDLQQKVRDWFIELSDIEKIEVPRCLRSCDDDELLEFQLHVFGDASSEAYGAVAYTRCIYRLKVTTHFVCSKTRVAPLTAMSIPRLELMAAVLCVRLGLSVAKTLEVSLSNIRFWSDSMNVLHWIRNRSRNFKPFVANRIGEIQIVSSPIQWRYVPTDQNPADIASRGMQLSRLSQEVLWWNGPEFLLMLEADWPQYAVDTRLPDTSTCELKKSSLQVMFVDTCLSAVSSNKCQPVLLSDRLNPDHYSDWKRLIRVCAWIRRFANNCFMQKQDRIDGELQVDEIQEAENIVLKACQQKMFADEYKALCQGKSLSNHSKLRVPNPRIDDDGLLRADTRLVNAEYLPQDVRYPVILPRKHGVTKLIVKLEHEEGGHVCGTNHILSELSKSFWIMSAREAIRDWENSCMTCKRRKARSATQLMAPLPISRLKLPEPLRCFAYTAVDYAGPFITVQGRGRVQMKRYLCLFTCMSTRAVHLEMSYGLDTDSFLNALYRFINRRGCPDEMTSDNGGNFVGAEKELRVLAAELDRHKIVKSTASRGIKWIFNPPLAPHFGGVFEIMIKAAKRAIYAILNSAHVTDEELMSAFIGAEALVNSRPLTYQSCNPRDVLPLTPSNFLHGELGRSAVPVTVDADRHPRNRWRRVQELIRHFWHRWLQEWIPSLSSRKKWTTSNRDFRVGDVVLMMNSDAVRGHWPLGRVIATHPGKDGHVRVVDVQIGNTVFSRAVTSLCPLEFADD